MTEYFEQPSFLQRLRLFSVRRVEPIPEVSPSKEQQDLSDLCSQIQGFSAAIPTDDASTPAASSPFNVPMPALQRSAHNTPQHVVQIHSNPPATHQGMTLLLLFYL